MEATAVKEDKNAEIFADWCEEHTRHAIDRERAEYEEHVRLEEEAILEVAKAKENLERATRQFEHAKKELSEAQYSLEIRKQLKKNNWDRLEKARRTRWIAS